MTPADRPAFDRRAACYDEHAAVQREAAAWLAEWLPEKIAGPALELGAGTGLFTRHLTGRTTAQLAATDIAPRMVETGAKSLPTVAWSVADASAPPRDHAYRWIFSASLIQWLTDPLTTFHAWHQVATPDARLLGGWFIRGTLDDFYTSCPEAAPFVWRDEDGWLAILREAGWRPVRHETRTFQRRHRHAAAMLREMHNNGTVIPRRFSPARLRRALRIYNTLHRDETGVTSTFEFLRVEAVRS